MYPNPGPFGPRARTGSSTARTAGYLGIGIGATATLIGSFGAASSVIGCWACTEAERDRSIGAPAAIPMSGIVALGVGIGLAVANGTSLDFGVRRLQQFRPVLVPARDVRVS